MSKRYTRFKELGVCVRCGKARDIGKSRCHTCHTAHLAYQLNAKKKAISAGLCRYCLTKPIIANKSMCQECLTKHSEHQSDNYAKMRIACIKAYGEICSCIYCNERNPKFMQLDHVNNDGAAHKKSMNWNRGGSNYLWAVRNNFPDRLQLLCANCHQVKTFSGGCTPEDHQY